ITLSDSMRLPSIFAWIIDVAALSWTITLIALPTPSWILHWALSSDNNNLYRSITWNPTWSVNWPTVRRPRFKRIHRSRNRPPTPSPSATESRPRRTTCNSWMKTLAPP
ncbi:unnamed protein product, partial [Aphanomyces euteiches]